MAEFDHGFKVISRQAGRELARLAGVTCRSWEVVESTLQVTTERLADRVFRAQQGRARFLVYMEFYTTWNPDALWNALGKSGLLSEQEKLPTWCLLFVLKRKGYRSHGGSFQLKAAGQPTQQLWFKEVPLWDQVPQPWWEEVPGLMSLYPLCKHSQPPRQAITHAVTAIEGRELSTIEKADYLSLLDIFGELAFPRLDIGQIIGREKMKGSRFAQDFMGEGKRDAILRILRARFGEVNPEAVEAINTVEDIGRLDDLIDMAVRCSRLQDFRDVLLAGRKR
jgi:hypothetical protein